MPQENFFLNMSEERTKYFKYSSKWLTEQRGGVLGVFTRICIFYLQAQCNPLIV